MDPLEAIGDPELREGLLFVRARQQPQSADELAEGLAIHRNVARSRLERLVLAGLLTTSQARLNGRSGPGAGRPTKLYAAAPSVGSVEFPERHYEALVGLLLDELPASGRSGRLRRVGAAFAGSLAGSAGLRPASSVAAAADQVCTALGKLGYQTRVDRVTDNELTLLTPTCPLRPLVRTDLTAVEIDQGMWAGLLAAALRRYGVDEITCDTAGCLDEHASCRVRMRVMPSLELTSGESLRT